MYRRCIFCAGRLGANESVERFPVGRTVAFDAAKGRLWAVCPRCARWNLAPIEERWEAVEDAERLFRDTRLRVQSENVGMAKLRDGTRLVRVGQALPGEMAAWRYGREMQRRRAWSGHADNVKDALSVVQLAGLALFPPVTIAALMVEGVSGFWRALAPYRRAGQVAHRISPADSPTGSAITLRWGDLRVVHTALGDDGRVELRVARSAELSADKDPVPVAGRVAATVLGKALARINHAGAPSRDVDTAMERMDTMGGAEGFLRRVAAQERGLAVPGINYGDPLPTFRALVGWRTREDKDRLPIPLFCDHVNALGLEMALHDETERRAMDGELAALEAMWREADGIAEIADALPDGVPPARGLSDGG
jgi:hypothetical protein